MDKNAAATITISVTVAWWFYIYLRGVSLVCAICKMEPDTEKVAYWFSKAVKMKLKTLKPRIGTIGSQIQVLAPNPNATPRLRGKAGVERRAKWLALHPLCVDCEAEGVTSIGEEVDHIIPLWAGGADDESNFASRCIPHHATKTAREAAERATGDHAPRW